MAESVCQFALLAVVGLSWLVCLATVGFCSMPARRFARRRRR